jgi:hypothetical protein
VSPPIYVGIAIAGFISLAILLMNRQVLNVEQTFPELMRYKLVRILFQPRNTEYKVTQ